MSDPHPPDKTPSIFISYRRADTEGHAGRLSDGLKEHFGARAHVFMDFEAIPAGEDFVKVINEAVGSCQALVALIGRQWLTVTDAKTGRRRLDNERDHVRAEIATALRRGVRVIPVLVQGAVMPAEEELPDDLKPLASRNALEVSGSRWNYDVQTLIRALEQSLPARARSKSGLVGWFAARPRHKAGVIIVTALVLLALSVPATLWVRTRFDMPTPTPTPSPVANGNRNGEVSNANGAPTATPAGSNTNASTANNNGSETNTNAGDVTSFSAVVVDNTPAVVRVTAVAPGGQTTTGTGFIVTGAGHILTADYVLRSELRGSRPARYTVRSSDGSEREATLQDVNAEAGLGLLKIEPGSWRTVRLAGGEPAADTRVVALGAIGGSQVTPLYGIFRRKTDKFFDIVYDLPGGAFGLGGGPVLNARGEAVGVSYATVPGSSPPLRQCVRSDIALSYLRAKGVLP